MINWLDKMKKLLSFFILCSFLLVLSTHGAYLSYAFGFSSPQFIGRVVSVADGDTISLPVE